MGIRIKKNLDTLIFEKLKDMIIAGRWKPGQEILIDQMADYFEVSRTPVIQASRMMAVEGMFNIKQNGRIEIPVFEPQQITDIYEMRVLLEGYALKTICTRKKELDKERLDAICREGERQQLVMKDAVASRRADLELHSALVDSTENECLISSYKKVQGQYMVANYLLITHDEKLQSLANDDHKVILDYLYQYDYDKAYEALEKHIMDGCRRVLNHINTL